MSYRTYVNYEDIVKKEHILVQYLMQTSEYFSVTAVIKKPYSQTPPVFNYNMQLQPFIRQYIYDKKDWPIDFLGNLKHQIMVICDCCKESCDQLLQIPNVFLPIDNDMPEDICFYCKGELRFATVSHEKIAFFINPLEKDLKFLQKNNIKFG